MTKVLLTIYIIVVAVFDAAFAKAVRDLLHFGSYRSEMLELVMYGCGVPVLTALLVCALRFRTCSTRTLMSLSAVWLVIWVRYYWFRPMFLEHHLNVQPPPMSDQTYLLMSWVAFVVGTALYSILPVLKYRAIRQQRQSF